MIVDSSALVAMIFAEPEAEAFFDICTAQSTLAISAGNFLETAIKIDASSDKDIIAIFDNLVRGLSLKIEAVTELHAKIARQAYRDFGKGSGHAANLNYGDCFAYALTTDMGHPLLYKGDDFFQAGFERLV